MSKVKRSAHNSEEASSSSGTSSSASSDEEVDIRDLKPIKDYLSDGRELARQLFKSVKTEKIQMMLPQALKKVDLGQLEKWCADELSGMSKARILSILNGRPMLESSDTNESDDSGPSLEIISDTEEWFTDEDISIKEEGSLKGKIKKDRVKQKGKSQFHKKNEGKPNHKKVPENVNKNAQIRKEEEVETNKEKEGDSLLDLLELEMRARAIRALIRKEEDIIPNASKSAESNDTLNQDIVAKTEQDEMKEKESCRRQLERIISAQQNNNVEDEDVVLVVQPTPTIELLSSDSEGDSHGGVRVNKKLENERVIETKDNISHNENRDLDNKDLGNKDLNNVHSAPTAENLEETKATKNMSETHKELDAHKIEASKRVHSNNVHHKNSQSKTNGKRRKIKKKSHTKEQLKDVNSEVDAHNVKSCDDSQNVKSIKNDECLPRNVELNGKKHESVVKLKANKQESVEESGTPSKVTFDEEKSIDLDEIIDLDDYCDDMDDMENNENDKGKSKQMVENKQCKSQTEIDSEQKSNGTETWASRYYQTDDVQNVIKESKIQSEIRKRLRERQRLSKVSTSPNKKFQSSSSMVDATGNKVIEKNPLGLVDEYLALKHTAITSLSTSNSSNSSSIIKDSGASINTCTDTNRIIENDHTSTVYSKNQDIDKEINLSDNANINNLLIVSNEKVVSACNVTNPG